jgi:MFS family permease
VSSSTPTAAPAAEPVETTKRALFAVIVCTALVGLTFGYSLPLLAIMMEKEGISATLIGLSAASESVAILLIGPFVPRLFSTFGLRRPMVGGVIVGTIMIGALAFFDPLYAWFPLRFVMGAAIFLMLIASDIWVTQGAGPAMRGRMIAIYGAAITGGIACGPLIVPLTGTEGALPFIVCAGLLALSLLPLLAAYGPAPAMSEHGGRGLVSLLGAVPILVVAVLSFGLMDSAVLSMMPIYGLHSGMTEARAVLLVTVLVAGSIVLQLPIGWLADRIDKYRLLVGCAVMGLVAAAVFPFVTALEELLWLSLLGLGGGMVGMYVVSLAILGDLYKGRELAAAISGFAMILAVGSTSGAMVSGALMRIWDPHGLNIVLIMAFGMTVLTATLRRFGGRGRVQRT